MKRSKKNVVAEGAEVKTVVKSLPVAIKQSQELVSKGYAIKIFDNIPKLYYQFLVWKHEPKGSATAYCFSVSYEEFTKYLSKSAPDFYKRYEELERQISELNNKRLAMLRNLTMAIEASGRLHAK